MAARRVQTSEESASRFRGFWQSVRLYLLAALFLVGTAVILLLPELSGQSPYDLAEGDVAPEDIRAPADITYVSDIETKAAQDAAAAAVDDIFDPPDPRVGRQQVRRAQQIMTFVADVRQDSYADDNLKKTYLQQISALILTEPSMDMLLHVGESGYDTVRKEVVGLIEDAMSGPVREGQVAEVANRLELKVSADVPEDLIPVTVSVARQLVVPNSVLNVTATDAARTQAIANVPVIRHSYRQNEVVVRAGERIDALSLEALQKMGLTTSGLTWADAASVLLISLLATVVLAVYVGELDPMKWLEEPGQLALAVILFLLFLLLARLMVGGSEMTAFLFPAAGLALALAAMVGLSFAALVSVVLAVLVGYAANYSLLLGAYVAMTSLLAAGSLRRTARLNSYFLAGLAAAAGGAATLVAFQLPAQPDAQRLAQLLLVAMVNGLLSAGVTLVILFVVGNTTGMATSLRLLDLLRPDHPLQRRLQQEALGTYQHTLSVANLVEAAAEAIGAQTLLARVGTLYHDIGKTNNPGFFIENRAQGAPDPHQGLSPLASARIIKAHVADGVDLAKRHRLPPSVIAFIREHHGTMPILFFLHKAREEAAEAGTSIDESNYVYDGPPPQSPETAILMLADGCESATRAEKPQTEEEIEEIVTKIIQQRIDYHQLDRSGLTLTQIQQIKESFTRTLKGMYHPRIRYPDEKSPRQVAGPAPMAEEGPTMIPKEEALVDVVEPVEAETEKDSE